MQIEPDSKTWRALEAWADKELVSYRAALEGVGMLERDADAARGAITTLKALKALKETDERSGK